MLKLDCWEVFSIQATSGVLKSTFNMTVYKTGVLLFFIIVSVSDKYVIAENDEDVSTDLYVIEGKVFPWENGASNGWQLITHVMANGGEHYGFLR